MKLFKTAKPVNFNITKANKGNGKGFNSSFVLERTRFPNPTPQDIMTRMIVKNNVRIQDLKVGDVLRGTRQEFHDLFGSHADDVNTFCQSASQTNDLASGIDIDVSFNTISYPTKPVVDDSLESHDEIIYKGVAIKVSITVGGVPFNTIEDAQRGIDLATKMLKVA